MHFCGDASNWTVRTSPAAHPPEEAILSIAGPTVVGRSGAIDRPGARHLMTKLPLKDCLETLALTSPKAVIVWCFKPELCRGSRLKTRPRLYFSSCLQEGKKAPQSQWTLKFYPVPASTE